MNKKNILKIIILIAIIIACILIVILMKRNTNVVMQVLQVEDYTNEKVIINEIKIQDNQTIELSEHNEYCYMTNPNDINILEITNDYVKIEREVEHVSKYEMCDDNQPCQEHIQFENVVEKIKYNAETEICLNTIDSDDLLPITAPKYYYYIKFVK